MTDLFDIEREAQRLERHLAMGVSPEVQLLVGLGFFRLLRDSPHLCDPDPYLLQFLPRLARAATKADPEGFFPDEASALSEFAEWVGQVAGDARPDAGHAIARLASASQDFLGACVRATPLAVRPPCHPEARSAEGSALPAHGEEQQILSAAADSESGRGHGAVGAAPQDDKRGYGRARLLPSQSLAGVERGSAGASPSRAPDAGAFDETSAPVALNCLFVEHFPDLDLPPRGRLLKLNVTATAISRRVGADDVVVRNPLTKPDDRFLAQARDSVRAARAYMNRRYGLPLAKRYRFDFAVDSIGARFTGDSLGVAFAAGAIAALGKVEVLRERLTISPDVAFSGALSANGNLSPVDGGALKRKIDRAFFSRLKYLVIPRENITEAWTYLSELESRHPGRKLELVGADALDAVAGDPRLVPGAKLSQVGYLLRRAWGAKRAPAAEVSVLIASICLLLYLVLPARYMPWFDRNPAFAVFNQTDNSLEARNRDSVLIWSESLQCKLSLGGSSQQVRVHDLNADGMNEVLFMLNTSEASPERNWLYCFSADHQLRFRRYCAVLGQYPGDTTGVFYDPEWINVVKVGAKTIIITEVATSSPARSHIRLWDAHGDSLGWYVNAGASRFVLARDLDGDGTEELLFLCYNNRMQGCALLVLNPNSVTGCSPPYADSAWDLTGIKKGSQVAYVLFPTSDVGKLDLRSGLNQPAMVREDTDGLLSVYIGESSRDPAAQIIYVLNRTLRAQTVRFTDEFVQRRKMLVAEGKLPVLDWSTYTDKVLCAVSCWRDSGWVTEDELRSHAK